MKSMDVHSKNLKNLPLTIPIPIQEEKCPVRAQVENKYTRDCNQLTIPKLKICLVTYKFYVGPHKGGFRIVNYNPRRTYCPLVSNQYTFRATKGSPQVMREVGRVWETPR